MELSSYVAVFLAIIVPAALYFHKASRELPKIKGITDFFPLKRSLSTGEYRATTVAAGMSLATVFIAFINLAPFLGLNLFISVVTMPLSFLVLYFFVPRIMRKNPGNDSIQSYLGKAYGSESLKRIALLFTLVGYISIFCMELIVGVSVLEPFLGRSVLVFSLIYLVFVVSYSLMSGYKAVVSTDVWQLRFIVVGILVLFVFCLLEITGVRSGQPLDVVSDAFGGGPVVWSFILGISVMNLPAPISDTGTWQRLCSTRDEGAAKRGVVQVALLFGVLWGALVVVGVVLSRVAAQQGFDPMSGTLFSWVIHALAEGGLAGNLLLFALFLGLFSAMISTADSLLVVAGQLLSIDIMKVARDERDGARVLRGARISMACIALASFALFGVFYLMGFDVVQLVFSIYGAQLAMFPAVLASLLFGDRVKLASLRVAPALSICCGFIGGWASALYGKFGGDPNWLYNAPVASLGVAAVVFVLLALPQVFLGRAKTR